MKDYSGSYIKPKKQKPFAKIPWDILTDKNLSHGAVRLYGLIYMATFFGKIEDGWVKVRNEDLCKKMGNCMKKSIQNYLDELEGRKAYEERRLKDGRKITKEIKNETAYIRRTKSKGRKGCLKLNTRRIELLKY